MQHDQESGLLSGNCTQGTAPPDANPTNNAESIYAEYILSRIPQHIRENFSADEANEIRKALVADVGIRRSAVKFRAVLPFFFRRYYLVVLFGRDRRSHTLDRESARNRMVPAPLRTAFYAAILGFTITGFSVLAFSGLYILKNFLEIDFFPNYHLRDFVNVFIDWIS